VRVVESGSLLEVWILLLWSLLLVENWRWTAQARSICCNSVDRLGMWKLM
jgi:hypothetical protein